MTNDRAAHAEPADDRLERLEQMFSVPHNLLEDISSWAPTCSCSQLSMLRLDRLHSVVSGNKWFKLKGSIRQAVMAGKEQLLTFGGGYSNHLVATAYAAYTAGLPSIGLVRGNYSGAHFTQTLRDCRSWGMELVMHSKTVYNTLDYSEIQATYPEALIIPEGGANEAGIAGASEIATMIPRDATDVCLAIGTGTTLNGLYAGLDKNIRLHGFYVARDFESAWKRIVRPDRSEVPELLLHSVQDPRFGKWNEQALQFIRDFYEKTAIPLDVIYTGKMMQQVADMLQAGFFSPKSRVVCIHTGGLQGNPPGLFPA